MSVEDSPEAVVLRRTLEGKQLPPELAADLGLTQAQWELCVMKTLSTKVTVHVVKDGSSIAAVDVFPLALAGITKGRRVNFAGAVAMLGEWFSTAELASAAGATREYASKWLAANPKAQHNGKQTRARMWRIRRDPT